MKIVLVYPRWQWFEYNGLAEPLGLLQVASSLRARGHHVELADYSFCSSLDELDYLYHDAGLCGVAVSAAAVTGIASKVTGHIRSSFPGLPIVAGGAYPSIFPEETIKLLKVDYVLAGEAEESMADLAEALEHSADPLGIENLSYVNGEGNMVTNPRRDVCPDLDSLPFPARDLVDYDSYLENGMYEFGAVTSRGCPFNCLYCKPSTDRIFGGGIRFRSAENVAEELAELAGLRGTSRISVFFKDDTITLHPDSWFRELGEAVRKAAITVDWHCATRVDTVTEEKLQLMAESGCRCISYGVESGSRRILDFYRKGTTPEQAVSAFKWSRKAGIEATAMVMIGCPEETEEDLEATYSLLKKLKPDDIVVYFSTAIPGREIHRWAEERGYLLSDTDPDLLDPARNRALEVTNMRLPHLNFKTVIDCKHRIEKYRSWRKLTSPENVAKWLMDLSRHPSDALTKAGTVLRGFTGRSDRTDG